MRWERADRPGEADRPDEPALYRAVLRTDEAHIDRVPWNDLFPTPEEDAAWRGAEKAEHEPTDLSPERSPDAGAERERPDEDGSWRGEGDQYLNAEENLVIDHRLDRVRDAEPRITDDLRAMDRDLPEGELVGLESRLKGEDRFKEKVADQYYSRLDSEIEPWEVPADITDAVRYTYQMDAERYVDGYREVRERIEDSGYTMIFARNSWDNPDYKGVNTRWITPEGQLFEVQFHTPESFQAKQETHGLYEEIRKPTTSREQRAELEEAQREISSRVPVPDRVDEIQNHRMEGY